MSLAYEIAEALQEFLEEHLPNGPRVEIAWFPKPKGDALRERTIWLVERFTSRFRSSRGSVAHEVCLWLVVTQQLQTEASALGEVASPDELRELRALTDQLMDLLLPENSEEELQITTSQERQFLLEEVNGRNSDSDRDARPPWDMQALASQRLWSSTLELTFHEGV